LPDDIKNPKETIRSVLGAYAPTADQARLTAKIDISMASRSSDSFGKLIRAIDALTPGFVAE